MTTGALLADTGHILVPADSRTISMRVQRTALRHPVLSTPNVDSVETNDERIGELSEVQPDWQEGLQDLAQSRIRNFNEALDEIRSLLQRDDESRSQERMARKPVLRSACRVSSVTAGNLQNNICKHHTKPTRRTSAHDFFSRG